VEVILVALLILFFILVGAFGIENAFKMLPFIVFLGIAIYFVGWLIIFLAPVILFLIIYNLARVEDILQKIAPIIEKQKNYLDIYNSIRLDKINSQTYKSTYISYVIIMVLCLYSLTKTSRKNSVVS